MAKPMFRHISITSRHALSSLSGGNKVPGGEPSPQLALPAINGGKMALHALTRSRGRPIRLLLFLQDHFAVASHGAALPLPSDPRPPCALWRRPREGRRGAALPVRLPPGPPLPLPHHPDHPALRRVHLPRRQAPALLPRPLSVPLQDQVRFLNSCASRSFSSSGSAADADRESDLGAGEKPVLRSPDHWAEVERVCRVVEELFASDRNMEAVLDHCGVRLSCPLVVDVLERFRHAQKPAYRFFRWAGQRPGFFHNVDTYNKLLFVLGKTRQFESMVALLKEMGEKGFLNMEGFEVSIKAFAAAREMKKAVGIFQLMKKHNFEAGIETFNCLLGALAKAKLGKEAHNLFEKMRDQYLPDLRTYTVLLAGWCELKNLVEAGRTWNEMIDNGFKPDIVAHNIMFEGLIRGQRRPEAIKLFELMKAKGPQPNSRTHTILIRDLCKGGKMEHAVAYFREMIAAECMPDVATYTCLLVGFGNAKQMDKVAGLLKEMSEEGCPPDGHTYNALIKLMTNRNMPHDAARIYKRMINHGIEPTIHTYNMMLKSYFRANDYDNGIAVWEEMNRKGICPDDNSYTVLIGGLIRHGRSEEAYRYLEEMLNKGMKAPQVDYNKFVADFSRAGKSDVLSELAQKMNFTGKPQVYHTFMDWAEGVKKKVKTR
ncbi:hypothetical protein Taro_051936 [Colocasia esculenta]|uniref:PROP1-like PPR domain-containing protein n=1 Tax=Colocasia esculenta TaxID=4460 RepID=A0A843XI97_COLES|nr:hypothetical protein [Colocasia esculenta]